MRIAETGVTRRTRVLVFLVCAMAVVVVCPLLLGGNQYALDVAQVALAFALFTVAWDFLCGSTGEVSFGHSLFVGMAAYTAALTEARLGFSPALAILSGIAVGSAAGVIVGLLTLRQTGAVFAMVTMAVQLTFHQSLFLGSSFFGGEEGIAIPHRLVDDPLAQYCLTALVATGGLILATFLRDTRFGRQLRAAGGDTRIGLVSGVPVPRVRVMGTAVSAFLASTGGSLLAMQNMAANHEMAGDALAGLIFLLAVIGGTGTLLGPWLAAIIYIVGLRHALSFLGGGEPVVVFGVLLLLIWLSPAGLGNVLKWRLRKRFESPLSESSS